jgi:hypothetical protein
MRKDSGRGGGTDGMMNSRVPQAHRGSLQRAQHPAHQGLRRQGPRTVGRSCCKLANKSGFGPRLTVCRKSTERVNPERSSDARVSSSPTTVRTPQPSRSSSSVSRAIF